MSTSNAISSFKRKYPRRIYRGSVGVLFQGVYQVTKGVSLGEGGMAYIWTTPVSTELGAVITFKIPGDQYIAVRAEIKNSKKSSDHPNEFIIGVQFLPLPIAEKRKIRAFVSSRLESEPII